MKYLPLTLLLLISCFFYIFPGAVKADECTGKNVGDACGAFIRQIDANNCMPCHGSCINSGSTLSCSMAGGNVGCSPQYACSGVNPTPTPITAPPQAQQGTIIGAQIPLEQAQSTINRMVPSQYSFQWLKYQFSLGSGQNLGEAVTAAKSSAAGGGRNYSVLVSVAKNGAGIETLKNPDTYPPEQAPEYYTHKYCPYNEELETYSVNPHNCGTDLVSGEPQTCYDSQTAQPKSDNGYIKFRDQMEALASTLNSLGVEAVEIWNEPNLAVEWTNQGLGPISPQNYANFFICGAKGLKKGGYNGKIITAAPSPGAGGTGNMDDLAFFDAFYNELNSQGQLGLVDAYGWHGNVTRDISPTSSDVNGFQRFSRILGKGKPVWLTEFGWDRSILPGSEEQKRQKQGLYIAQAYGVINSNFLNKVTAMFVWNFGFTKAGRTEAEFVDWDIEGITPQGRLCQPNAPIDPRYRGDRRSTTYVQDKSLSDDEIVATVAGLALVPKTVIEDANQSARTISQTKVDTKKSFYSNLPLLGDFLSQIANLIDFFRCMIGQSEFCKPNLSIGIAEKIEGGTVPGKNTASFASEAQILGQAAIPNGMELVPEERDCNIGFQGEEPDPGHIRLNTLSETMGTTTGFYGNNMPDFKTLTPDDWLNIIKDRMQQENLNIGSKLFNQDKRSPDLYVRKQVMCKGLYPEGICPFEPSPTPTI